MNRATYKTMTKPLIKTMILPLSLGFVSLCTISYVHADTTQKAPLSAPAAKKQIIPNDNLSLKYDLTRSDLSLMKLKFNVSLKGDKYHASHNLKSKGLVKLFADLKSSASVEGRIKQASLLPLNFQMSSGKKNKIKNAKLTWADNKLKREVSPALNADRAKSLEPVLNTKVTDPLTGLLSLVLFDDQKSPCNKTIRVFEGRKVFDLAYSYSQPGKILKSDLGSFRGQAHECFIKLVPVAGYSDKKMKKMLKADETHKVWMARIKSPTSDRSYLVPVKMKLTTKMGTIDVSLRKGKINGNKLRKAAIALR